MILVEKKLVFKTQGYEQVEIEDIINKQISKGWDYLSMKIFTCEDDYKYEVELSFIISN